MLNLTFCMMCKIYRFIINYCCLITSFTKAISSCILYNRVLFTLTNYILVFLTWVNSFNPTANKKEIGVIWEVNKTDFCNPIDCCYCIVITTIAVQKKNCLIIMHFNLMVPSYQSSHDKLMVYCISVIIIIITCPPL